ncbi:carbonic anhydrase [Dentipellis sp. KUC8613]|nr:carbonic anhydrase [Dentipellis sp. KUC8613]
MSATAEFVKGNEPYAANFGDKKSLTLPPKKKIAIVTCMDSRLDPAAHLGFKEGDAAIIRNAGGLVSEALRSLIISQRLLGAREVAVFHHTDCGMLHFHTPQLRKIVKDAARGDEDIAARIDAIDFHEFSDVEGSIKTDVDWLKEHPLIPKDINVTGWVYEVETGKVRQVV